MPKITENPFSYLRALVELRMRKQQNTNQTVEWLCQHSKVTLKLYEHVFAGSEIKGAVKIIKFFCTYNSNNNYCKVVYPLDFLL